MISGGFSDAAKIPELRSRVWFTIFVLLIYRLGVFVPTPGVDTERLVGLLQQSSGNLFGLFNMFSGGALENFSVFALGIMPYISVSIIMQLLGSFVKSLEELREQGEQGKKIITRYTRLGTIALALVQGLLISIGLESQGMVYEPGVGFRIMTALTLTAGTAFLMWIGEQINERGIGNGISVIIMAGILARMPTAFTSTFGLVNTGEITPFGLLGILTFALLTIAFIVYVERSQRRIPVQYPRRQVGQGITQATSQHLPLRLNSAGVMPPIFASAFLMMSVTLLGFLNNTVEDNYYIQQVVAYMSPPDPVYYVVFGALIIFFCYFWIATVPDFNPNKIADNLKKNGGFIPTVRPGKDTADYINVVMGRLTFWGSLYICAVCIIHRFFTLI